MRRFRTPRPPVGMNSVPPTFTEGALHAMLGARRQGYEGTTAGLVPAHCSGRHGRQSADLSLCCGMMCEPAVANLFPKVGTKHRKVKNCVTNFVGWLDVDFEKLYREDDV